MTTLNKTGLLIIIWILGIISIGMSQVVSTKSSVKRISLVKTGHPEIQLQSPIEVQDDMRNGYIITDEEELFLNGKVHGENPIKSLTLNGKKVSLQTEARFSHPLFLNLGANNFKLEAKDEVGNLSQYFFYVNRTVKEKRVALVIGNANYQNASPLKNPPNDAEGMTECLKELNFEVYTYADLNFNDMRLALRDFSEKTEKADVIWVYYAGHGIQVDQVNYLVPIDAVLAKKGDVPYETFSVNQILNTLEKNGADGLNILVLDACRNNPFKKWARGGEVGLAKVEVPTGTLIAFSTSPDSYASDGTGKKWPIHGGIDQTNAKTSKNY